MEFDVGELQVVADAAALLARCAQHYPEVVKGEDLTVVLAKHADLKLMAVPQIVESAWVLVDAKHQKDMCDKRQTAATRIQAQVQGLRARMGMRALGQN